MPHQKPTTALLKQLRSLMLNTKYVNEPLNAYIVPSNDAHNTEHPAEEDKRRDFISGFTGSAGTAVITHNHACVWTDGRYYLQASQEMDSNWTLMKDGIASTPTEGTWLSKNLPSASFVGVDPKLMPYNKWVPLQLQLEAAGHKLIPVDTNLVDLIWNDKPLPVKNPVIPLALQFSGKPINEKFTAICKQMKDNYVSILVLTALDEIAWFLNLRGSDIMYNPVFFSYVIIFVDGFVLLMDPSQVTPEIEMHIKNEAGDITFKIEPYTSIVSILKEAISSCDGYVWMQDVANYALASMVPPKRLYKELNPVILMKAIKNPIEINGMKNAHIKDAVALCCYFSWIERSIHNNEQITEISAAAQLVEFRKKQLHFMGPSFETISCVGAHGAIIHYRPDPTTDFQITGDTLYLCDSGGQYKDGTTDVTRTFHFGNPTEYEKECYTRVLKGQLKLGSTIFPAKLKGSCLDSFARQYLWEVGLDYAHGTGHGVGSYLHVHEGPMGISFRNIPDDPGLQPGMFISNEPGYYEEDKFGIRIEDIVVVVEANPPYASATGKYLTFENVTLVPKQTKLIKPELMTQEEMHLLNQYHERCREILGPLLEKQGCLEAKEWLWKETEPLPFFDNSIGDSVCKKF